MAAKQNILAEVHEALAQLMLNELRWYMEQEPPIPLPAADKAAIAKFLKDNSITCDPTDTESLKELRDQLEQKREGNVTRLRSKLALVSSDVEALYS
jgi:hypothetical protein